MNKTRYITSFTTRAPVVDNQWGTLAAMLKAVLSEGFNQQESSSVDISGGEVTIHYATQHGYEQGSVIRISGNDELQGDHRILRTTETSVTIQSSVSNVTETLTTKTAPLGYQVVYDQDGTVCFKSKDGYILKVIDSNPGNGYQDTWAKYARVVAGKEIDSQGNFVNNKKIPRFSDLPDMEITGDGVQGAQGRHGALKWYYSVYHSQNSTEINEPSFGSRLWYIIGDDRTFYLFIQTMHGASDRLAVYSFGAIQSTYSPTFVLTASDKSGIRANNNYDNLTRQNYSAWGSEFTSTFRYAGNYIYSAPNGSYTPTHWFYMLGFGVSGENYPPSSCSVRGILGDKLLTLPVHIGDSNLVYRGHLRGIRYTIGVYLDTGTRVGNSVTLSAQSIDERDTFITFLFPLEDWE